MWTKELEILIRARYPAIWLVTDEEERIVEVLRDTFYKQPYSEIIKALEEKAKKIAEEQGVEEDKAAEMAKSDPEITNLIETTGYRQIYEWSAVTGIQKFSAMGLESVEDAPDLFTALQHIQGIATRETKKTIFVLKDPHDLLRDPLTIRQFKETYYTLKTTFSTIVLISPILNIPVELQKMITVMDTPLPTAEELKEKLLTIVQEVNEVHDANIQLGNGKLEEVVKAGLGLTMAEFEHTVAKSIVKHKDVVPAEIVREKEQIIRKTGVLEYYHSIETTADIGGLENLKDWLIRRKAAFTEKARKFGLKPPKGILLAGAPGTGKSLTAKVTANIFGFPLLRMDVSAIFGQYVGESEKNMRTALKIAESVAPSILWLDEIERILAGHESSGSTDSGVTSRVIGQLLTWMQERTAPVFVIATTNDPLTLPPQLMRAGRFDEVFHVDLPDYEERKAIFSIHLKKVNRNPENFDLDTLAAATEGFVGAEIEQVIQDALYLAWDIRAKDINTDLILTCIEQTTPLSKKRAEEVERMRRWAEQNAKPANRKTAPVRKPKTVIEL